MIGTLLRPVIIGCALIIGSGGMYSQSLFRGEEGDIAFVSDAPLEVIKAKTDRLRGIVDPDNHTFAFSVDINSFVGFNSDLQQTHFNENYLESHLYPQATFAGKVIEDVDWYSPGAHEVRAKGLLKIHGIEVERIILSHVSISEDTIEIESHFSVSLMDHEIEIPKIVSQKISQQIEVHIAISLTKSPVDP